MAIPSLAEIKVAVSATEIAPFEAEITAYLETPATLAFLENATITDHTVIRTYKGKELTAPGIAALKASIEAASWTDVKVENQFGPAAEGIGISSGPKEKIVFVSFKPAAGGTPAPAPGVDDDNA